jgi:pimeloyl-ACP methyl ester carboxylesterase
MFRSKAVALVLGLVLGLAAAPAAAQAYKPGAAEQAQTRFVAVGGDRVAYREVGRASSGDAPLLLLHRFRATMDDWDPAFINAVARKRRVILFDNVGVGESGGKVPASLEQQGDAAVKFVQALRLRKVDVLGWSMGGMTAQIVAIKHPDVVRKLVIIGASPPAGSPEVITSPGDWSKVAAKPAYTDADLLYLFFSPSPEGAAAGRASLARTSFRRPASLVKTTPQATGAQYQAITSFFGNSDGWYQRLKQIKAPTLVANGDRDGSFPVIDSVVLAREIPDARLAVYPDSGHGFQFQYPERFAADLVEFLGK